MSEEKNLKKMEGDCLVNNISPIRDIEEIIVDGKTEKKRLEKTLDKIR